MAIGDEVNVLEIGKEHWGHIVREAMRRVLWEQAANRRPDMAGVERGIDREITTSLVEGKRLKAYEQGILRNIFVGAVWTQDRRHRANLADTGACRYCDPGEVEDHHHLWWRCPAWSRIRQMRSLASQNVPPCVAVCGLIPENLHPDKQSVDADADAAELGMERGPE